MKIYTKTGDQGMTSLYGGARVSKSSLQIDSYGTLDEFNSYIGLLRSLKDTSSEWETLKEVQDRLFTIGSYLASDPKKEKLAKPDLFLHDVERLEQGIDKMDAELEPLKHFVLPGGSLENSYVHLARVCCRKVERLVVSLVSECPELPIPELVISYLNRLSDYLFILSRFVSHTRGEEEFPWHPRK